jgi:hypothetical protein
MPNKQYVKPKETPRNAAKLRALRALKGQGWRRVTSWANAAGLLPVRRAYTYALRLERYRLVERARGRDGRWWLSITVRGLRWLAWYGSIDYGRGR